MEKYSFPGQLHGGKPGKSYVFVLGKNPALSSAEIFSYLRARGIPFSLQDHGREFLIIDMPRAIPIESLGGTIKVGKIISSWQGREVPEKALREAASILSGSGLFGVSAYGTGWKGLASRLKSLAGPARSCKYMDIQRGRSSLSHVEVIKKNLVEDSVEFLLLSGRQGHLARTVGVHNPFEFQKRDMERPFKRPMLSIPPRLCRIMVNLSGQTRGILLDPFCGIGTLLQEAMLMGFTVWGIDTDGQAVEWARRNLKWLTKEYLLKQPGFEERVQKGDARKLPELFPGNSLDAIVTEPYLGPPLKRNPDLNRARRIIREVRPLYQRFLRGASDVIKLGGRLVVVSPYFDVGPGRPPVRLNMEGLARRSGFTLANPLEGSGLKHGLPLLDREERHRTIREISVMEAEL
jgi:tRNA G10  N-methylase Trm11